jgi:hypothetical protein
LNYFATVRQWSRANKTVTLLAKGPNTEAYLRQGVQHATFSISDRCHDL